MVIMPQVYEGYCLIRARAQNVSRRRATNVFAKQLRLLLHEVWHRVAGEAKLRSADWSATIEAHGLAHGASGQSSEDGPTQLQGCLISTPADLNGLGIPELFP